MKRVVILDTRTKWHVDIPDDVPREEAVTYAWSRVLKLSNKVSNAKNSDLKVQIEIPKPLRKQIQVPTG